MKFTIVKAYSIEDPEFDGDPVNVRLLDVSGSVVLSGDWYHDKIEDQIKGFLKAIAFVGEKANVETRTETSEEY